MYLGGTRQAAAARGRRYTLAALAVLAIVLTGCASAPANNPEALAELAEENDPSEPANRMVFAINMTLEYVVVQPLAVTYRDLWPDPWKIPIRNLIDNMRMPLIFVHSLLQGNLKNADIAAQRFFANMLTLWLGDLATGVGVGRPFVEDAGQTLAVYGAENGGPYLMLPLFGPSNFRDGLGRGADIFLDPLGRLVIGSQASLGRTVVGVVDQRSQDIDFIRELQESSVDFYARVRSLYRQNRISEINNGDVDSFAPAPSISGFEDFEDDDIVPAGGPTDAADATTNRPTIEVEFLGDAQ